MDQPEGNGTGFVWDKEGHIITNFHVLGSALQQASRRTGAKDVKVARVTLVGVLLDPRSGREPQSLKASHTEEPHAIWL